MPPSLILARSSPWALIIQLLILAWFSLSSPICKAVASLQLVPGPDSGAVPGDGYLSASHSDVGTSQHRVSALYRELPLTSALSFCPRSALFLPGYLLPMSFLPALFELSQLMPGAVSSQLFSVSSVYKSVLLSLKFFSRRLFKEGFVSSQCCGCDRWISARLHRNPLPASLSSSLSSWGRTLRTSQMGSESFLHPY